MSEITPTDSTDAVKPADTTSAIKVTSDDGKNTTDSHVAGHGEEN
jgi:hypothetical protein